MVVQGQVADVAIALRLAALTDTVVVAASQVEAPLSAMPVAVTVLTARDLDARQVESTAEVLRVVAGFSVAQSGGRGALTSIFPRGGESDYTLVMSTVCE